MRRLLFVIPVLGISIDIAAQATVSGRVTDNRNRPLPGVSISIRDSYDGAVSDSSGGFQFKTFEKGEQVLRATLIGYKPYEAPIDLSQSHAPFAIILKEEITELKAVTITAGSFEASDRKRAGVVLNSIDIVTTASANADVTQALKTLPGAQQVGESEGLFVRGGTASETRIYIDGTPVNKFFYSSSPNVAGYGRFSPFLFKGTVFSTGGYSALYGQALSSAVVLESIDLPERTSASLGISPLGIGAGYQHLNSKKTASWGAELNYTHLGPTFEVIRQRQDYFQMPAFTDIHLNFRLRTSSSGMLKFFANYSSGRFGFHVPSIDSIGYLDMFRLTNRYAYHNLAWKEFLGKGWRLYAGFSHTYNQDRVRSELQSTAHQTVAFFRNFQVRPAGNYLNAKLYLEKKLRGLSALRFGSDYNHSSDETRFTDHNGNEYHSDFSEQVSAFYTEADIYLTNALAAKLGTRLEYSSYLDKSNWGPRISLAYRTGKQSQASLAYGIYYQNPDSRYLPSPYPLGFLKASHYIVQYMVTGKLTLFRAEVFYKEYMHLLKTGYANGREVALNTDGRGNASGFEIFWRDKKSIPALDYWISYSFLDTKRDYLNFPFAIRPHFAARHTASLVVKKFVMPWKTGFNLAYNYASSRPYYHIAFDGHSYLFTDRGEVPDYHNVSFSLNFIPGMGKPNAKSFAVYVISVNNIFNIKQVYGYQYSYHGLRKAEIQPPSRMFVYVGAFFSFGIDRTQDAINRNL